VPQKKHTAASATYGLNRGCRDNPQLTIGGRAYRRQRYTEGMANAEIQIVSNEAGEPTAVIVPIELWREIESERETAYLLKSETMKQRLLTARQRRDGLSLEAVVEKLRI
jgi:antitoxin YefM